ncbi:MAG TPA: 2-C-methyl-D-erythritol 4-phosphate cytidylyltransferase [Acidobacteriota bacterium]|jgi:2-C-methyl-D-erythritol 4-phosphate cytidylyltransferase
MNCAAIIAAAGSGSRLGSSDPKQLLLLGNIPLFLWSVRAFRRVPAVTRIIMVVPGQRMNDFRRVAQASQNLTWVEGGLRRQDSVRAGLGAVGEETDVVLVHDAARPFVTPRLVELLIDGAWRHGAAIPIAPVTESLKRVSEGQVVQTVERSGLFLAQTPQAFRREMLRKVFSSVPGERTWTDEASMFEYAGLSVVAVEGDYRNIKITYPEDLKYAEFLLHEQSAKGLSPV